MTKLLTSWKTSLGGFLSLLGGVLMIAPDNAPGASYCKPWAGTLVALGAGLTGLSARDNNVTSTDAGATSKAAPSETPSA